MQNPTPRRSWPRLTLSGVIMLFVCMACLSGIARDDAVNRRSRILVFTKTAGFRHASIPDGIAAMGRLAERHDLDLRCTEDASIFTPEHLQRFDVIVFLNTSGDVLDDAQQRAMRAAIEAGCGFVGVHAASDTEYDWPWYGELIGAWFRSHPPVQDATIIVEDLTHPSTRHLDDTWPRRDEWYDFRTNPRERVRVLMRLDRSSYDGSVMEDDHPIAWYQDRDGVRSFYTAGGHTSGAYRESAFLEHLAGGVLWAARRTEVTPTSATTPTDGD